MSYNAKNYTEQGGDVTHIGGKLVFDDGGSIAGFPGAENQAAETPNSDSASKVRTSLNCPFFYSSLIDKEDEIISEIIFVQFLIRLAGPIEKPIDIAFVGVIGLRTESPQFDFRRQLLPDFFLGHVKNSFILFFRSCGVPSIKVFMYNGSCLRISVRVTLIGWGTHYRRRRFSSIGR